MKELEDLSVFPSWLRDFQTEYIGAVVVWFRVYDPLLKFMNTTGPRSSQMVDLCSGSGAPAKDLFERSRVFTSLKLTDKFPNLKTAVTADEYVREPTDVLTMRFNPDTSYTMFNAFHHFDAFQQRLILERIRAAGASSCFVEILKPDLVSMVKVLFLTTVGTLVLTPFVRPFSFARLFFTYVVPINVLTITWDGLVSVLKSSTEKELRSQVGDIATVTSLGSGFRRQLLIHIP